MFFEQVVSIYGTITVNAKTKTEAEDKINNIIWNLKDKHDHLIKDDLIIGDIERETDVFKRG